MKHCDWFSSLYLQSWETLTMNQAWRYSNISLLPQTHGCGGRWSWRKLEDPLQETLVNPKSPPPVRGEGKSRGEIQDFTALLLGLCCEKPSGWGYRLTGRQRLLEVGGWQQGQWAFSHPSIQGQVDLSTLRTRGSVTLLMGPVGHTERKRNLCVKPETRKAWHWCPGGHRNFEPPFPDHRWPHIVKE